MNRTLKYGFVFVLILAGCSRATSSVPIASTPAPASPTIVPVKSAIELAWNIRGAPNPFDQPNSLAVDRDGNLYVLDAGNNRIQKFDQDGKFLLMWGALGAGHGEFNFIRQNEAIGGLDVDAQGNVYVADNRNHRIQKFDGMGTFIMQWGSAGTEDGQFVSPIDVAVDGMGNVYVVDDKRDVIQKFDQNGRFILKWGGHGKEDGQLFNTGGLAVDHQGNVYVADFQNQRVQKFDGNGTFLAKWGSLGAGNNQFEDPCDIAVDAQNNVYVSNYTEYEGTQPRIQEFDGSGHFLF